MHDPEYDDHDDHDHVGYAAIKYGAAVVITLAILYFLAHYVVGSF